MRSPETVDLEDPSQVDHVSDAWLDLASRLPSSSYFQTPDWVLGWWEKLTHRPPTSLAFWSDPSGRLSTIVPITREHQSLFRGFPIGSTAYVNAGSGAGAGDHCGWLVSPGQEQDVREWLLDSFARKTLLLRSLPEGLEGSVLPAAAKTIDRYVCPRMTIPSAPEVIGRSANFRHQLRAYRRRLEREGVVLDWVGPGRLVDSCLTALFELHRERSQKRATPTEFGADQIDFHRYLMERGDRARGPAAVVARHGSRTIGVLYGFRWRDVFYAYQAGWDPSWERFSLGTVLLHEAIVAARSDGARVFDFLRGAEPYKYRFGAADVVDGTWILPRGPGGWALERKYRARGLVRGISPPGAALDS